MSRRKKIKKPNKIEAKEVIKVEKKNEVAFEVFFRALVKKDKKMKNHCSAIKIFCEKRAKMATIEEWFNIVKKF